MTFNKISMGDLAEFTKEPGTALLQRNRNLITSPGLAMKSVKSMNLSDGSLASPQQSDEGGSRSKNKKLKPKAIRGNLKRELEQASKGGSRVTLNVTTDKEKKKILTDFKLKMREGLEKRLQKSTSYKIDKDIIPLNNL